MPELDETPYLEMQTWTAICKLARDSCRHARRWASQHETYARMHADVQASTRHVHACTVSIWNAKETPWI